MLVLSIAVGVGVTVLLWGGTRAEHRDAFDTGWKSAAAVLAILAAVVTVERLRLGQREHHRQLAADRAAQITDLSAKASEQLGSEKAAVRIGGLTDLERLAQTHPDLRQTVVDRICAYLRAPYRPPPDRNAEPSPGDDGEAGEHVVSDEEVAARRLELDVRRTAQQILQRHLHWDETVEDIPETLWDNIKLDLRDAVLVEFDLTRSRIASADFRKATFHSEATFTYMVISQDARFDEALFIGNAEFRGASFPGKARFGKAVFGTGAKFTGASFGGTAWFSEAAFHGEALFEEASFAGDAAFGRASFGEHALFEQASFGGVAGFRGTSFAGGARFGEAAFEGTTSFGEALFAGEVLFDEASFAGHAWFGGASFAEDVTFTGASFAMNAGFDTASFDGDALFGRVSFGADASFEEASFAGSAWFAGASFAWDARFDRAVFDSVVSLVDATVVNTRSGHVLPAGWVIQSKSEGTGARRRIVRGGSASDAESPEP
ncbi:pentapeptide repeat-containing protein [Amycolatopsis xylanica]|uniref:pentapeptide repeat-containing protein n=1 Tax=Amycolatopsis xylanica TaxID=589385 RepID=UPI0015A07034|nr:pentapeptide repeat-containing protein [Amycolatopsis xylanica]